MVEILHPDLAKLPEFRHLLQDRGQDNPHLWRPVVINPHLKEGREELIQIAQTIGHPESISMLPYEAGQAAFMQMVNDLDQLPSSKQEMLGLSFERVKPFIGNAADAQVLDLLRHGSLFNDVAFLRTAVQKYVKDPDLVFANARWVWDPMVGDLNMYLGPEELWLSNLSRMPGLIPFDALENLRHLKIRILGASVAASTIDLLVALGASDIVFCDYGDLTPEKSSQMPGRMGEARSVGKKKVRGLLEVAYGRYPYGNFVGIPGRVLLPDEERQSSSDIYIDQLVGDADLVSEVVDNRRTKAGAQQFMEERHPNVGVVFIADLGSDPIAGIVNPQTRRWFNQNIEPDDKQRMVGVYENGMQKAFEDARGVYLVVGGLRDEGDLPLDHGLQYLFACMGLMKWWSQTPISARQSASIAATLVLQKLQGGQVEAANYHLRDLPTSFIEGFNPEEAQLLKDIFTNLFNLQR